MVCIAFDRIVERVSATLQDTDIDLLLWLNPHKNEAAKQTPSALPQDIQTLPRYIAIYKHFICYMLRIGPATFDSETTSTGVVYSSRQCELIVGVRIYIDSVRSDEADGVAIDGLMSMLFRLLSTCIQRLDQNLDQNQPFTSPMMH